MIFRVNYKLLTVIAAIIFVFACLKVTDVVQTQADVNNATNVELPIVMYHHVLKSKQGDYIISPDQFENDLKYLTEKGYQSISAAQLKSYIEDGSPLPPKPVMITFDDGYESVYAYAFPLLKKYDMTAIISVIGKHTDIFSNPKEGKHLNYSHLSWDELREMQQSGVFSIENHTYDMHDNCTNKRYGTRILAGESAANYKLAIDKDVGALNKQIEQKIGVKPLVFAYPFGALCKESKLLIPEYGFTFLLTCEEKVNKIEVGMALPTPLKRYNRASHYGTAEFFSKMNIN